MTPINAHESKQGGKLRGLGKKIRRYLLDWFLPHMHIGRWYLSSVRAANDRQGVINFCRRCRIIYVSPLSTGERINPSLRAVPRQVPLHISLMN